MKRSSAAQLLRYPVLLNGIRLGQPVDLVLAADSLRAVGLEVRCGDEGSRFLPLAAARIGPDAIAIGSAYLLLEGDGFDFYRRRARTFRSLRGQLVRRNGSVVGSLDDLLLEDGGRVVELAVAADGGTVRVPVDANVSIDGRSAAAVP